MNKIFSLLFLTFFLLASCAGPIVVPTKSAQEHFGMGKALVEKKDYDKAVLEFQKAIAADPMHIEARYELGKAYMWGFSNYDLAVPQFQEILKINPNHPGAHYELGLIHYLTWDYYNNLAQTTKAKADPQAAKELQQAIMEYEATLKLDPNFAMAYNNLGVIYSERGDTDKAISMFEKAVKLLPTQYQIHGNLGYLYFKQGKYSEALLHLKENIRLSHEHHEQGHQSENIIKLIKSLEDKGIK
ncbi:MAG: tetratricopeptide repeat protein [Candidatus Tectomicrobia bacterium]|uniref:Tetratricopeptide repeat protein n=1 Tax=Tectimicrobiota bacterium TaxID=2528274 RepID=A0A933GL15_UNCTE|nr:tetratricopeptide repeat protein [Candidatus Tectomicrobia bacterium]